MDVWDWLVVYILLFGLIQVGLYRYFRGRDPSPDPTPYSADGTGSSFEQASTDADGVRCQRCGTVNDAHPTVRFCRGCVAPLR